MLSVTYVYAQNYAGMISWSLHRTVHYTDINGYCDHNLYYIHTYVR